MQEVGRGRTAIAARPVLGRLAPVRVGAPARPPEGGPGASQGLVALVGPGVGPEALAPLEGALAAIVCVDEGPDAGFVRLAAAQGLPCLLGARFDGGPPEAGALVFVDCDRAGDGLVLVVDGGATGAADASIGERA